MKDGQEYEHAGEIDQEGKACGYGVTTRVDMPDVKTESTYFDN